VVLAPGARAVGIEVHTVVEGVDLDGGLGGGGQGALDALARRAQPPQRPGGTGATHGQARTANPQAATCTDAFVHVW